VPKKGRGRRDREHLHGKREKRRGGGKKFSSPHLSWVNYHYEVVRGEEKRQPSPSRAVRKGEGEEKKGKKVNIPYLPRVHENGKMKTSSSRTDRTERGEKKGKKKKGLRKKFRVRPFTGVRPPDGQFQLKREEIEKIVSSWIGREPERGERRVNG